MDEVVSPSAIWILLALLAASLEPVVAKFGFKDGISALQLLFVKNLFAFVSILPITHLAQRGKKRDWLRPGDIATVASVSLLLMLTNACSLLALSVMPAITVITLTTTTPAFVGLVNQFRGRDRLTGRFWLGLSLCFLGVLLVLNVFEKSLAPSPLGLLAVAVAVASSTTYRTRMEVVTERIPPILVSTYIFLINGSLSLLVILPFVHPISGHGYAVGAWLGVAAAVANVAFLYAIHLVGSTNMSVFNLLQTPIVLLIAAVTLREPMTAPQMVGVVLVLGGVRLAQIKRPPKEAQPAEPES